MSLLMLLLLFLKESNFLALFHATKDRGLGFVKFEEFWQWMEGDSPVLMLCWLW